MQAAALMFELSQAADDAFGRVVREREALLLRIAWRILGNWSDAEDIVQEAFLRLHRHGLHFDHDAALAAWLYRVTVNLCVDRSRRVRPAEELQEMRAAGASAEAELIRDERKRMLMRALAELPAKARAAVVLREIEGLTTAEVAEILRSSEETVRSQISRSMARLRELLREET